MDSAADCIVMIGRIDDQFVASRHYLVGHHTNVSDGDDGLQVIMFNDGEFYVFDVVEWDDGVYTFEPSETG